MAFPQTNTIAEIITKLNRDFPNGGGEWLEADDLYALTTVQVSSSQTITFQPNSGLILKAFRHSISGEIKIFLAKVLGKEGRNIPLVTRPIAKEMLKIGSIKLQKE